MNILNKLLYALNLKKRVAKDKMGIGDVIRLSESRIRIRRDIIRAVNFNKQSFLTARDWDNTVAWPMHKYSWDFNEQEWNDELYYKDFHKRQYEERIKFMKKDGWEGIL